VGTYFDGALYRLFFFLRREHRFHHAQQAGIVSEARMKHLRLKDERVKEGKRVVEQWKLTPNQWTSVGVMMML